MRKLFFYIVILSLLMACKQEQPTPPQIEPLIDLHITPPQRLDAEVLAHRQQRIQSELEYYLQRHRLTDEGYDVVVRYAEKGDSVMAVYMPKSTPNLLGMFKHRSYWRQGFGPTRDGHGRIYIGIWDHDTLRYGLRIDSAGIYAGEFDHDLLASGHGCYSAHDGAFYEGQWVNDKLDGNGFSVSAKNLQSGTWRAGRFHGERIQHTSDRIYGIDLSRYQHESGRRRHGINWNDLRVTNLGRRINNSIKGETDYPVRFIYIKSTQGTTIRNRYFATDYMAARKHNLPVGAYHFFSTVRNGKEQAQYFLNQTLFKKGDLPPVLDLEPTDKQIQKMGGKEVLLREVRHWIAAVEKRLKVRPILYVNQRFVTTYLHDAPDLLENYLIWIARYGEYKPGVHLVMWQLSADSRVKGIHTDVDVNVFNGYEPQWEEFLKEETIK